MEDFPVEQGFTKALGQEQETLFAGQAVNDCFKEVARHITPMAFHGGVRAHDASEVTVVGQFQGNFQRKINSPPYIGIRVAQKFQMLRISTFPVG